MGETFNHAVLDSGCTKTVCEGIMVKDTLSADNKQEVVEGKGDTKFKFGVGNTAEAIKDVKNILGQEMDIKFNSSGHFHEGNTKYISSIENISNKTLREKQRTAEKLHKQFRTTSSNNI